MFETQEIILRQPAIFIAAVNGYALGGGFTLVHNSEIAIASEKAEFGASLVYREGRTNGAPVMAWRAIQPPVPRSKDDARGGLAGAAGRVA